MSRTDHISTSDEDQYPILKQIHATHAPDGRLQADLKSLLGIIDDILGRPLATSSGTVDHAKGTPLDDKVLDPEFIGKLEEGLSYTMGRITWQISSTGPVDVKTVAIFNTLSRYSWDAKVVIALAVFALNYGELCLAAQMYSTKSTAKILFQKKFQRYYFQVQCDIIYNLTQIMLEVTKCIVELEIKLTSPYIPQDTEFTARARAFVSLAVHWTIRSIVSAAGKIMTAVNRRFFRFWFWQIMEAELHEGKEILGDLKSKLTSCHELIDEKRRAEAFPNLQRLFQIQHEDNREILEALINYNAKDDQLPLFDGSTKQRVSTEVLRNKNVLLFISDLESSRELSIVAKMYTKRPDQTESQFQVVWLPIVDLSIPWNESTSQKAFEDLRLPMPCYSVSDPSQLDAAVIKYVKEVWRFSKDPVLTVLDEKGRIVNPNAIHIMWIWGSLGFPFTSEREEALWGKESWIRVLFPAFMYPSELVHAWISEKKYICVYGGDDIQWVREFTSTLRATRIPLEMLYVGKSNPKEKVGRCNSTIVEEHLSHTLPDLIYIWFFWIRIESMLYSKTQQVKSADSDPILQEIVTMLSFNGSDQGWAVIFDWKSEQIAKGSGDAFLKSLKDYDQWEARAGERGFVPALIERFHQIHTEYHCNRLTLSRISDRIPDRVVCAECGRPMEKLIMFRCCIDLRE